jgi:hypothetical protein
MSDDLVSVALLSGIASSEALLPAGTIVAVRADVAAAWIADGLARAVEPTAEPETTMRFGRPRRSGPR